MKAKLSIIWSIAPFIVIVAWTKISGKICAYLIPDDFLEQVRNCPLKGFLDVFALIAVIIWLLLIIKFVIHIKKKEFIVIQIISIFICLLFLLLFLFFYLAAKYGGV